MGIQKNIICVIMILLFGFPALAAKDLGEIQRPKTEFSTSEFSIRIGKNQRKKQSRKKSRAVRLPAPVPLAIENSDVLLTGSYYGHPDPEAPAVVGIHGFTCNEGAFDPLAKELQKRGYRVYLINLRGHGPPGRFSKVKNYRPGDYGYFKLLEDTDMVVRAIYGLEGRKPVYMGHSMGSMLLGMIARGVYVTDSGRLAIDDERAEEIQRYMKGFVDFGGPYHFRNYSRFIKLIARWATSAFDGASFRILPFGFDENMTLDDDEVSFLGELAQRILPVLLDGGARIAPKGFINGRNLESGEGGAFMYNVALNHVHSDLLIDFARFVGRGMEFDGVTLDDPSAQHVPMLVVAGEHDSMAQFDGMMEKALNHGSHTNVKGIMFKDRGHVDILYGRKNINLLIDHLIEFIDNPRRFGKGWHYDLCTLGECGQLLTDPKLAYRFCER